MSRTPYVCLHCHKDRFSSNPRASLNGTVCPTCAMRTNTPAPPHRKERHVQ